MYTISTALLQQFDSFQKEHVEFLELADYYYYRLF